MAKIRELVAIDPLLSTFIIVVDGDPSVSPGVVAGVGSIAIGPTGQIWQKTTSGNTGWILAGESRFTRNRVLGTVAAAIGSTDTKVATGAFAYQIGADVAGAFNTFKTKGAVAAGTFPTAQTVPADKWAGYLYSIDAAGTIACTPAALNTTGYATEALALAAIPATPAASAPMVYVTVLTGSGLAWVGATDAFAGGTTGNEATTTNYYEFGAGASQ